MTKLAYLTFEEFLKSKAERFVQDAKVELGLELPGSHYWGTPGKQGYATTLFNKRKPSARWAHEETMYWSAARFAEWLVSTYFFDLVKEGKNPRQLLLDNLRYNLWYHGVVAEWINLSTLRDTILRGVPEDKMKAQAVTVEWLDSRKQKQRDYENDVKRRTRAARKEAKAKGIPYEEYINLR